MDHDVLDLGEAALDLVVDPLRRVVCLPERQVPVHGDLHFDIDAVAELPRLQQIDPLHLRLLHSAEADLVLRLLIAAVVHHFVHRVPENVRRGLGDEDADHNAGQGVQHGKAGSCAEDAGQGADGGEGVGPMVPGLRHQRGGIQLPRKAPDVTEQQLLHQDGYQRRGRRQDPRRLQLGALGEDLLDPLPADDKTGGQEDAGEQDRRHALHPLMAVGVFPIRILAGELDPHDHHQGAEHIRGGVDRVGDHRPRVSQQASRQLPRAEQEIDQNADPGYFDGFLRSVFHGFPFRPAGGQNKRCNTLRKQNKSLSRGGIASTIFRPGSQRPVQVFRIWIRKKGRRTTVPPAPIFSSYLLRGMISGKKTNQPRRSSDSPPRMGRA